MNKKRITSLIMSFVFLIFTTMGAFAAPKTTITTTTTTVKTAATDKAVVPPVVTFDQKPYAEYVAGSNVYFKIASTTASSTTKVQYSAKLFNLDTNKKEMDIRNYGAAYYGAQIIAFSFTVKNPGNYRLAVYVKVNGTKGIYKDYYDNYVTNDFKVVNSDKIAKASNITIAPIKATVEQKGTYKLPTTVNGKDAAGKTKKYSVTWDNPVNTTTPGAVVFTGTVKDTTTKTIINNLFAKLTLTITPLPIFDDIKVTVDALNDYKLPVTINGIAPDGKLKKYDVAWDGKANTTTPGAFTFSGKTIKDTVTKKVIKNASAKLILTVLALPIFDTQEATVNERTLYSLPTTVTGKLYDGTTKQFGVVWDKSPITTTPGAFLFNGTIKDAKTSEIVKNVSAKFKLTVVSLPTFDSIVAKVDQGTDYKLPDTVIGKLSDGTTKQFGVTWDNKVNTAVPGTYTFIGTIKDPATSEVINNTQVVLTLTVNAVPVIAPIVDNVIEGANYTLPSTVTGKMYDGSTKSYTVTWDKSASTTTQGTFTFTGTLKDAATTILLQNVTAKLTLVVNPLPLQATVTAYSQKAFKIAFNKQVDYSKCTFAVTMNSINIPLAAAWDSDGKSVQLQSGTNLAYGVYIIKVNGAGLATDTYSVEVKSPALTSVSVLTAFITPNNSSAKIMLSGMDQYGQGIDVASSDFMWIVKDNTAQVVLSTTSNSANYINVQTNVPGVKTGDKVSVYGINTTNSTLTVSSLIEINTKAIDTLTLKDAVIPNGSTRLMVNANSTYYEIPYNAIQNYVTNGVSTQASAVLDDLAETSLAQAVTLDNFIFVTDKTDILKNIKVVNGKLYVQVAGGKYGTAKLTVSGIPAAGQTSSSNISTITMNIASPAVPDSLVLGQPSGVLVTGGSVVKLGITINDQYGSVMSSNDFAKTNFTDFTLLSSNTGVATAVFDSDGSTIDITPVGIGNANITIVNKNSGKTLVYQAVVNEAATVKDFSYTVDYPAMIKGATAKLQLTTLDQYGNKLTTALATYKYTVSAQNGAANVNVSSTNFNVAAAANPILLTGVTANKAETITVTLYNDANGNNLIDSGETIKAYAFTENVIADNEQLTYSANTVPVVYAAVAQDRNNSGLTQDAYGAIQNQNNKNQNYAQKITMSATKADGTRVALVGNPITDITATVNSDIIDYSGKLGNDFVVVGRQWSGNDLTRDANVAVNYIDNTGLKKSLNTKVTVSKESLKATTLRAFVNTGNDSDTSNDIEITGGSCSIPLTDFQGLNGKKMLENQNLAGVPVYFEVDDQYGVSSINPLSYTVASTSTVFGTFTMDSYGVVSTSRFFNNETVTITATDTEGHTLTITVKVK